MLSTAGQQAPEVVNLCRIMAEADGLDWDEVCAYENDSAENLGDVACDSGTCVAAHYEDHDVDVARGRYITLATAVLASFSRESEEGNAPSEQEAWRDKFILLYQPPCGRWYVHSHKLYDTRMQAVEAINKFLHADTPTLIVASNTLSESDVFQRREAGSPFLSMDLWDNRDEHVMLLVDYGENGEHAIDDASVAVTIGHNNDHNVGDGEGQGWQFAGWCWSHDHYTQGKGKVIGWLPLTGLNAHARALEATMGPIVAASSAGAAA